MAKQTIFLGVSANDGKGTDARDAFDICNDNFTELYDGKLALDGSTEMTGDLVFTEAADHSSTPAAGKGYLWVKSDTPSSLIFTDDAGTDYDLTDITSTPEGTAILSTGEAGGTKFLREDGDGTSSWQPIPAPEGTDVLSTGPVTDGYVLTADGAGGAAWEAAAGGGLTNWEESGTTLQPTTAGYDLGSATNELGDVYLADASEIILGSAQDLKLARDAANTLALRNSTNAQTFNVYGTYTDSSNYERLAIGADATSTFIRSEAAGTGTERDLYLGSTGDTVRLGAGGTTVNLYNGTQTVGFNFSNNYITVSNNSGSFLKFTGGAILSSTSRFGWTVGNPLQTEDTSMYRDAAGVVRIDDALRISDTGYTVANLPTGTVGTIARVTDGDAALTHGDTVVNSGSGATPYLVWYNGTNWTILGS